jgi:uncharacterized protein
MNKFIKPLAMVLAIFCFFSLTSCSAYSKVKSVVETDKENATAETMSSASLESIKEGGEYPSPIGWVSDFAGVFKQEEIDNMNKLITDLEKKTTAELAVVTIKSLNGKTIETYANELFNTWGIGKKEKNNGILLLISIDDRKLRIEVGYGLENVVTDVIASKIINEVIVPYFKQSNYGQGAYEGVKAIAEKISPSQ